MSAANGWGEASAANGWGDASAASGMGDASAARGVGDPNAARDPRAAPRPLHPGVWFAIGMGAGVLGLLPWLITGARLPLQNLAADPSDLAMPFVLLPLSQYSLTTIVALLVAGGASAGIAARALSARRPRFGVLALTIGVVAVQLAAIVQAFVVTAGELERSSRTALYLGLLVAVCVIAVLVSLLVLLLTAHAAVPGATIALVLAAIVSGSWVGAGLPGLFLFGSEGLTASASIVITYLPAVLVGSAIAWCGVRTAGRVAAVLVSLLALWIGPAFFQGVAAAAGTRILLRHPAEMGEYAVQVFFSAASMPEIVLPPLIVALVVGIVGRVLIEVRRASGAGAASESGD